MKLVRNRLLVLLLHSLLCVCAVGALSASSASAQSGNLSKRDLRLQYVPTNRTMEELQREYDSIRLWGPAVGVPVSYFTAVGGFGLIMAGNFDLCSSPCVDEARTPSEKGLIAAGSIVVAMGITGFVASIVRIVQKREKKRRLHYEMGQLRFGS